MNESLARALVARLNHAGIDARAEGAGVHWHVDATPVAGRTIRVHCFWYERSISALMLGMNPSNSRSQLNVTRKPTEGAEYLTVLKDDRGPIADGRTHDLDEVITAAHAWLAGTELDRLTDTVPFIDERGRAMRALALRIAPQLRRDIGGDPGYHLWVYGDGRSCRAITSEGGVSCSFWLGPVQVALARNVADAPTAIEAWLSSHLSLRDLAARITDVELERHAEVLESDPARWHWLHVLDRIANPADVLAPLRDLIVALASSPVATRFYSYSSLNRFCFSSSSHYPWVDDGLPVVWPRGDGEYDVDAEACYLERAMTRIEDALTATPVRPFFGSAAHHELSLLADALARTGSTVRPRLVQREQWFRLVVDAGNSKTCEVAGLSATLLDGLDRLHTTWPTIDDLADVVRRYCEQGATLEEIASDPRRSPL